MKTHEERILQITNDIAEDISNRVTPRELRDCIAYWASKAAEEAEARARAESMLEIVRACVGSK